jgi:hypothetical protein
MPHAVWWLHRGHVTYKAHKINPLPINTTQYSRTSTSRKHKITQHFKNATLYSQLYDLLYWNNNLHFKNTSNDQTEACVTEFGFLLFPEYKKKLLKLS